MDPSLRPLYPDEAVVPLDVLWNLREVEMYLKISRSTVYRWVKAGKLVTFKVGRQIRVKRNDIINLVKTTTVSTTDKK